MDHLICIHYFLESLHFELSLLLIKLFITYKLVTTYMLKTIGISYKENFFYQYEEIWDAFLPHLRHTKEHGFWQLDPLGSTWPCKSQVERGSPQPAMEMLLQLGLHTWISLLPKRCKIRQALIKLVWHLHNL